MHSTVKLKETDPRDVPAIAPDVIPAAWADKVLADVTRDAASQPSEQAPDTGSSAAAAPTVDTTFRAAAADNIHVPGGRPSTGRWTKNAVRIFMLALCGALAAAWQHYGDAARPMISNWVAASSPTSTPPPEKTDLAGQPGSPAVQASAADQTPSQPASPAQPPEGAAPAATALSPDTAQLLQSMARDLAAMGRQIEQLKASIAELKAGQQPMARDVAKSSEAKTSGIKPAEVKPSVPNQRPRLSPPPRSAAAPARKPMPAYPPAQAAALPPLPQAAPPPTSLQSAPPPQTAVRPEDEPVVRPPMPLR
jgi:hypothetical protein